ncbi:hypothetical protein K443DRAFT_15271 [Laccaria amethystina LaAM-08-1]|uniref:Uncharacterized protein n=1 Tax=Laccaria amethystina LaAM-08-1 TaxID=1095629 RepID=A0A0C9WLL8_9AGAR|nr:hypothetical protein K443DRAFT_15271 [Laccaria amethystina LaAM-08-1]
MRIYPTDMEPEPGTMLYVHADGEESKIPDCLRPESRLWLTREKGRCWLYHMNPPWSFAFVITVGIIVVDIYDIELTIRQAPKF